VSAALLLVPVVPVHVVLHRILSSRSGPPGGATVIVVTVELHSAIDGHVERLGTMVVGNDGSGTPSVGNYNVFVGKRGQTDLAEIIRQPWRRGRIEAWPRNRFAAMWLINRAFQVTFGKGHRRHRAVSQMALREPQAEEDHG
jgi:hypothetical protein